MLFVYVESDGLGFMMLMLYSHGELYRCWLDMCGYTLHKKGEIKRTAAASEQPMNCSPARSVQAETNQPEWLIS